MENNQSENNNVKKKWTRGSIILLCVAGLLFLAGVFLIVRQFVFIPGRYEAPPVQTVAPTLAPTPASTPEQTAAPTPSPTPYVQNIPIKLYFTEREVSCEILPVGIIEEGEKAGKMDTIDRADVAAWYQYGPSPGEGGNALLNGHVRWKGVAGTFSVLPDMQPGEKITIEYDNNTIQSFVVDRIEYYPYDAVPESVMDLDIGGEPRISLISCFGKFNYSAGTSSERVIVVCVPE